MDQNSQWNKVFDDGINVAWNFDCKHASIKFNCQMYIIPYPHERGPHYGISAHPPLWAQFPAKV